MSEIAERQKALRKRLIRQAADAIDMGDYRDQMRAYQEIMLEMIDLLGLIIEVKKDVDIDITVSEQK